MRIGFVLADGTIYACVTVQEETLAEWREAIAQEGENGKALDLFADPPPARETPAIAALDALIDVNSGDGTICGALEWLFGRVYEMAYARGKAETLADLDAVVERVRGNLTPPTLS